jgi:hypothetical protein
MLNRKTELQRDFCRRNRREHRDEKFFLCASVPLWLIFRVPKWCKTIIAILLLPVCVGATKALLLVIEKSGAATTTWVPFIAGVGCWLSIYILLPRPTWVYVFGHELTHAFWAWLFGAQVKKFKASSSGGHVLITKTNFLIALAPYFFPIYAAMIVGIFFAGHLLWNWKSFLAWFHLFLGAAYAFHVTLTAHVLQTRQTDITSQGYLFSAVIIFLGNVSVLLIGVPLIAEHVEVATALGWWLECTREVFHRLGNLL